MDERDRTLRPGITLRSVCAAVFCMLVVGMGIQYAEVIQAHGGALAEQSVSLPAVAVLVLVLLLSSLSWLLSRHKLLSRAELLCVLYAMLISTPMMTQGMWHRFFGIISATPREGNFQYIDALSDKLWPHGPNLVDGALTAESVGSGGAKGTVEWGELEVEEGQTATVPVLRNAAAGDVSSLSLRIPVAREGSPGVTPGQPVLVSFLARPAELSPESFYFARLYEDGAETFNEAINERKASEVTFLHKHGFLRVGKYGVDVPTGLQNELRLEIGLSGSGELAIADPKFFSVAALEGAYRGRRIISESEWAALPASARAGLVVKPDNMWSPAGLKFLVTGFIPLAEWREPAMAWLGLIGLLLLGLFAVAVLLRRQWAEGERYPFPLARIPLALIGEPEEGETSAWSAAWRSRIMWAGFAVGLFWGLMRMWAFYNTKVPDMSIDIPLKPYFSDPGWGEMWNVTFAVSAVVVSICIFFELNVLLSFVLGFFVFRALYWVGEFSGLKVYTGYPFKYEQAIGAYLAYAAVVLFFMRKVLWRVVRDAFSTRNREVSGGEALTYRSALLVLAAVHVGIVLWALWLGVPVGGILLFFVFLMLVGFVAMKVRGECGLPAGYFTPYNAMLFVAMMGGMPVFGASGLMVCLIASGFMTVSVFFFIPGTQLELLEYGRRYGVRRRHLGVAIALGVLGGLFIGGWVFLSNSYAIGGANIRYQWSYNQGWFFSAFKTELAQASSELLRGGESAAGVKPATWAYVYGGGVTLVLALLRQFFAGFWFHPVGFILGSAHMLEWAWGSVLVAWTIRSVVLKFGGAATVKTKLFPFFVGVFLGSVVFVLINVTYAGVLQAQGVERIYMVMP